MIPYLRGILENDLVDGGSAVLNVIANDEPVATVVIHHNMGGTVPAGTRVQAYYYALEGRYYYHPTQS